MSRTSAPLARTHAVSAPLIARFVMGGECSHSVTNVLRGYGDLETEHPCEIPSAKSEPYGVSDGARTRDIPDHNRMLYQLSYAHHVLLAYPNFGLEEFSENSLSRGCIEKEGS